MAATGGDAMNPCECGCGRPVSNRYAQGHARRRPVRDRLIEKTLRSDDGCWVWTGALASSGYGRIGFDGGTAQVHRVAYEVFVGPIPDGLHLDHLCGLRTCVNPAHLEPVTQAENNRRAWAANRWTHCRRGHEFTPENTVTIRGGGRNCRECKNRGARERRRTLAAAGGAT